MTDPAPSGTAAARRPNPTGLPVVGMVGGGQLARMTHQAGIALGMSLRVLAERPDDSAALVAADVEIGSHRDLAALRRFAAGCDVVTFDHEHVPQEHLRALAAAGVTLLPGADALLFAQDKLAMRRRLGELAAPVPAYQEVDPGDPVGSLRSFADRYGWPVVAKAVRGGYDGRGVWVLDDEAAARSLVGAVGDTALYVEQAVPIVRELAALVARSPFGQAVAWPVVETVQADGICVEVVAPAPGLDPDLAVAAERLALELAAALGVVGVMAVELFETGAGLLVNELAMRPHNSGHWTIEGAVTSQFEQHLRAVADLPFGDPSMVAPVVVMANVLGGPDPEDPRDDLWARSHHAMAMDPGARVHLYGKGVRPGRKIGHVTVAGADLADLRARATAAADHLRHGGPR